MKSTDPSFTDPALAVIRQADPDLVRRIDAAPELITVVTDPDESAADVVTVIGLGHALDLDYALHEAFGVTQIPRGLHEPMDGAVWLVRHDIENEARELGIPVDQFTALILAHEFRHHDGGEEKEAYAQGTTFARKLGNPALLTLAEKLAGEVREKPITRH